MSEWGRNFTLLFTLANLFQPGLTHIHYTEQRGDNELEKALHSLIEHQHFHDT
jgi:hypothetical protein